MSEYVEDVSKYTDNVDADIVDKLIKYCGIALRTADGKLVAATDKKELDAVRDGFAKKKLELSPDEAQAGIDKTVATLKGVNRKNRVTFYYLLAKHTGTLDKI